MKTLLTIFTLVFTLIFSSTSFAEWTEVGQNEVGDTYYVDLKRIRKHDGFVYVWRLADYFKPTQYGDLSAKLYLQVDCKLFGMKVLSASFHKQPMGGGIPEFVNSPENRGWDFPPPNSAGEAVLKYTCMW